MIGRLSPSDARESVEILARVAVRLDPFDFVPRDGVTARIVTIGPFYPRESEYATVMDAAEPGTVLLANLMPDGSACRGGPVWTVSGRYPFEDLKSDPDWNGISESVLWHSHGTWTVVVSNEGHGILAGPSSFVSRIATNLPHHNDDLREVIERLVGGRPDTRDYDDRLLAMVSRLYGAAEARSIRSRLARPDS